MDFTTDQLLDEGIRDLSDLKRMSRKPYCIELMRQIVAAASPKAVVRPEFNIQKPEREPPQNGVSASKKTAPYGLSDAAIKTMRTLGSRFTINDLLQGMEADNFRFVAEDPKVSLGDVLKRARKKGLIRIVKRGSGSEPNQYEFITPTNRLIPNSAQ